MNYPQSRIDIVPTHSDTPCLLAKLRDLLRLRTDTKIPFFLMPVRMETRFMRSQPTSLLAVDCYYSPYVVGSSAVLGTAIAGVASYGVFRQFTSNDIVLSAAQEMLDNAVAAKFFIDNDLPEATGLNPAESDRLMFDIDELARGYKYTSNWLKKHYDGEINANSPLQELINVTQSTISDIRAKIAGLPTDMSWESNVSVNTVDAWAPLQSIIDNNAQFQQEYILNSELQQNIFDQFISSSTGVLDLLDIPADGSFDMLYVWNKLKDVDAQFSKAFNDLANINATDAARTLFALTKQSQEAWEQYCLPGKGCSGYGL